MPTLNIGVVGYSTQSFNSNQANAYLQDALNTFQADYPDHQITLVSGLSDLGIPALAYRQAKARGWRTMGIASRQAMQYPCFPVDEQQIIGHEWGDESETFLGQCHVLVRIGGGPQAYQEATAFAQNGQALLAYELPVTRQVPLQSNQNTNIQPWQLEAEKVLFSHPRFKLYEDTVTLPTGAQTEWLRFGHQADYTNIICLNAQQHILIARQYCHPPQKVVYEFPGGMIDFGETMAQAARRELVEEVGWYPQQLHWLGAYLANPRRSKILGHVFVAQVLEARPTQPEDNEFIGSDWLTPAQVDELISQNFFQNSGLLAPWSLFRLKYPALFT